MRASELAYKAAQEMAQRGHCKKVSEDREGRVCFYGAINRAEGIDPIFMTGKECSPPGEIVINLSFLSSPVTPVTSQSQERQQLIGAVQVILQERGIPGWEYPHQWNDLPYVTGEDVILLLKEAGARLEARGC